MIKRTLPLVCALMTTVFGDPVITGLSPETMPTSGGTLTISGSGLYSSGPFGSSIKPDATLNEQSLFVLSSSTSTQLLVTVPAGTGTDLPLVVELFGSSDETTLSYSAPVITEISGSPTTAGGQSMTVSGSNFGASSTDNQFRVAGNLISPFFWSQTSIRFSAPAGTDSAQTQVTVGGQTSNIVAYDYPNPVIDSFSATSLPTLGGTEVTVTGSNLSATPIFVLSGSSLDQTINSFDINSDHTQAKFTLPEDQGIGSLLVKVGDILSNSLPFAYDAPEIELMTPSSGLAIQSETVTLSGKNFGASPQLTYDGLPITTSESSHSSLTFTRPISSSGQFHVVVSVGDQTSNTALFIALSSPPGSYIDLDTGEILLAPAGSYAPNWDMTNPIEVPAGFYSPVAGLPVPIPAPNGTWAPLPGSTEVMMIPPGFTVDPEFPQLLNALPSVAIQSYKIKEDGQHEISFSTQIFQNYGIFYTTDLVNYVLIETAQGLGADATRSLVKPGGIEERGFWVVAPRANEE